MSPDVLSVASKGWRAGPTLTNSSRSRSVVTTNSSVGRSCSSATIACNTAMCGASMGAMARSHVRGIDRSHDSRKDPFLIQLGIVVDPSSKRPHSAIGMISPVRFEAAQPQTAQAA